MEREHNQWRRLLERYAENIISVAVRDLCISVKPQVNRQWISIRVSSEGHKANSHVMYHFPSPPAPRPPQACLRGYLGSLKRARLAGGAPVCVQRAAGRHLHNLLKQLHCVISPGGHTAQNTHPLQLMQTLWFRYYLASLKLKYPL